MKTPMDGNHSIRQHCDRQHVMECRCTLQRPMLPGVYSTHQDDIRLEAAGCRGHKLIKGSQHDCIARVTCTWLPFQLSWHGNH